MLGSEISAEAAYEAALDRALRTAEALIRTEGLVVALRRELAEVTQQRDQYAKEAVQLHEMRRRRRVRDRARRALRPQSSDETGPCMHTEPGTPCDWDVCRQQEGGGKDAAEDADPDGYTYAVGQAD